MIIIIIIIIIIELSFPYLHIILHCKFYDPMKPASVAWRVIMPASQSKLWPFTATARDMNPRLFRITWVMLLKPGFH